MIDYKKRIEDKIQELKNNEKILVNSCGKDNLYNALKSGIKINPNTRDFYTNIYPILMEELENLLK